MYSAAVTTGRVSLRLWSAMWSMETNKNILELSSDTPLAVTAMVAALGVYCSYMGCGATS
jgi:hypothetical protein